MRERIRYFAACGVLVLLSVLLLCACGYLLTAMADGTVCLSRDPALSPGVPPYQLLVVQPAALETLLPGDVIALPRPEGRCWATVTGTDGETVALTYLSDGAPATLACSEHLQPERISGRLPLPAFVVRLFADAGLPATAVLCLLCVGGIAALALYWIKNRGLLRTPSALEPDEA